MKTPQIRHCPRNGKRRQGSSQPLCFAWEGDPSLANRLPFVSPETGLHVYHWSDRGGRWLVRIAGRFSRVTTWQFHNLNPSSLTTQRVRVRSRGA